MEEKPCLEAEIASQRKEVEKRDNVLTGHLNEISKDLNQLKEKFSQQEK
jgi:hypothetical protein